MGNLGTSNSPYKFRRTTLLELFQIPTISLYVELCPLCLVFGCFIYFVLSQTFFLLTSCRIFFSCTDPRTFFIYFCSFCRGKCPTFLEVLLHKVPVLPIVSKWTLHFAVPSGSKLNHSYNFVLQNTTHSSLTFSLQLYAFCLNAAQASCKPSSLSLSGSLVEMPFAPLCDCNRRFHCFLLGYPWPILTLVLCGLLPFIPYVDTPLD